mgnify:CR=1 FL=1
MEGEEDKSAVVPEKEAQDNASEEVQGEKSASDLDTTELVADCENLPTPFFQGGVVQAIAKARLERCAFVVSIQGTYEGLDLINY